METLIALVTQGFACNFDSFFESLISGTCLSTTWAIFV
jgi:hypothetical protein